MKIKKAILPVAGLGTRFLPATKAQPKEMLPVYDTPAIQYIVQEAVEAGIEDIILVTGKSKRALEDHFDSNKELEASLERKGKMRELEMIQKISSMANFIFVRQSEALGDGHAIACAKSILDPNESVVVLFGDDLVDNPGGPNAVKQLLEVHDKTNAPVVLLEEIAKEDTEKYGIVDFESMGDAYGRIKTFVEKPKPEEAPSNLGVVGKFILTPEILRRLGSCGACADGEIRLANAFMDHLAEGKHLYGRILEGQRFDTGDKLGFLKATLHYALGSENGNIKAALKDFLNDLNA